MRSEDIRDARAIGGRADRTAEQPAPTGVVVGVDGSLTVLGAVAWAGAEAARRGVGLHLVQVLPGGSETEAGVLRGRARALLHRAMGAVEAVVPDVAVSTATVHGSVGPALVSYADRAQMLVVGSHGSPDLFPLSAGRALTHVTSHAGCPVVAVPPKWPGSWPSTRSLRPVAVGVDGSGDSARALDFAAESAQRLGVDLIALTAGNRSQDDGPGHELIAAQLAGSRARHPGLAIEARVVGGEATDVLRHAACQAQLLVVGCRGRGAAARALLGSTSRELLRDSPCAVAVLSPRTPAPPALPSRVPAAAPEATWQAGSIHGPASMPSTVSS